MNTFKTIVWPCITIIVVCISWVLINGDKVIDNIEKFKVWYGSSAAMEGIWDNSTEGDIDPPLWLTNQNEFVQVRLTVKDSILDGTISSENQRKHIPFDYILLTGKKRPFRDVIDAEAFDYIGGKRVSFGKFTISIEGDALAVESLSDSQTFFPKKSMLIKQSTIAFPELSENDSSKQDGNKDKNPPK
ncbi:MULTISPECIES: hypothetical protein [Serratia]|uniref:Uncharacterized protein n=1 Tax=Serratia rhizosphaerae TaxID=2597702 RepID=A0ABX6GTT3_9GAMM|nr:MULTISPECIES: hypothetical protein [Serratia]MBH2647441.1 hypothetical protein [Serratia ureilytica]QHA89701.1 hypothetical protein FO014_23435 [Serratia rhizosphaerae]